MDAGPPGPVPERKGMIAGRGGDPSLLVKVVNVDSRTETERYRDGQEETTDTMFCIRRARPGDART